ncbi:tyrosine-type recombinase/integrase [Nocardia cyriacigeorgica]|uniref:tyrosine-type recombinase/integrase n=1 Tax=Nocardia cyriacigeorgica TaxID=135487 RepID=UPI001895D602|nr:site-specific integrase [Nocardia cyriacigeorgica]MBF6412890.1 site-specific integrase [Nocardia cyriacigeorgica]
MASVHEYKIKPNPKIKGDKGIRYRVAYSKPDGKPTGKRGFLRKGEANAFANSVEEKKRAGEYVAPALGRRTVGELAPEFLRAKKATLAESTYKEVEAAWRNHVQARWESVKLTDVAKDAVEAWITDMRLAAKERQKKLKAEGKNPGDGTDLILRAYGVLAGILDLALTQKRVAKNPVRGASNLPKKTRKRYIYLESPDVNRLAAECESHRVLVLVLAYCGLRWSEAIALKVSDINFKRARISVDRAVVQIGSGFVEKEPKSHEIRDVPAPRFVLQELQERVKGLSPDDLVFPDLKDSTEYLKRPQSAHGWFVKAVKAAKVQRITPHDLRHTCASLAVSAGANVKALARMLGHADASETLNTYADLFDSDLDEVAKVMHLNYGPGSKACQNLVTDTSASDKAA